MTALYSLVTASGTSIALDASNGVVVEQTYGLDMPPVSNQGTDYALLDGASWQRARAGVRVATLQISAIGTSVDGTNGLHKIRAKLVNAVNPHRHGSNDMRLNYTGNSNGTRYLNCRYDSGLEGGDWRGFTETMTLRLLATDPYWYANTGASGTMANRAALTFNHIGSWTDGAWSSMGGGLNADVNALAARPGGGVYVGGEFDTAGATTAQGIAVWTATTGWAGLGGGITRGGDPHGVNAIAVAPNGDVYAGGLFSKAGNTTARSIAVYDVSAGAWGALNGGVETSASVNALTILNTGVLYAGGGFTTAGSTTVNMVAAWNGSNWASVSNGISFGTVWCLEHDSSNNVYAGGYFSTAGSTAAHCIAMWNGNYWSGVGGGFGPAPVASLYALAYDRANGYLYAGGSFETAGGVACKNIARWNGRQWEPLGGGVSHRVWALRVLSNGWLLAAGLFSLANGDDPNNGAIMVNNAALWNGYSWVPIPGASIPWIYAFAEDDASGAWYLGGNAWAGARYVSARKTLTNVGSARAYPIITITATATHQTLLYIRNDTTDQTLWFYYPLDEGETLTIDCRPGAKNLMSSFYGAQVGDNPLPGSQLATFCLNPGANNISTLVDGASTTVTFTWTPTYWSRD